MRTKNTFGEYVDGYLIDYLYDDEQDKPMLAWRTPEGAIKIGAYVDIDGVRYEPWPCDELCFYLKKIEMKELIAKGIPRTINTEMREKAEIIQMMLLRWRLETWEPGFITKQNTDPSIPMVYFPMFGMLYGDENEQGRLAYSLREYLRVEFRE